MKWTNKDFGIHTVTENQDMFSSENLTPDQTFEYTLIKRVHLIIIANYISTLTGKVVVN